MYPQALPCEIRTQHPNKLTVHHRQNLICHFNYMNMATQHTVQRCHLHTDDASPNDDQRGGNGIQTPRSRTVDALWAINPRDGRYGWY